MLKGRDVVIISSVEWDSPWRGAREIAARQGEAGNRVLYVENTGIRSPAWRDKDRVASRVRRWRNSLVDHGARRTAEKVFVCSPHVAGREGASAAVKRVGRWYARAIS
ncbi:MAG: hypothetical protein LC746_13340 [Acidobacteria bacterium]|nr:hypothetical protein [Acidobacteriota bacterium]